MYLHLGQNVMISSHMIIGIFDLDNTSWSYKTRQFLEHVERNQGVITVGNDIPKSFVLCQEKDCSPVVYLVQLNTATLLRRIENEENLEF